VSNVESVARTVARKLRVKRLVDRTTALGLRVASPPYLFFTWMGPAKLPTSRQTLRRMGLYPIRDHYYQPLFNDEHLTKELSAVRALPGINWRHGDQVALMDQLTYRQELVDLDLAAEPRGDLDFSISNPEFGSGDAEFLYSMVRLIKPARVIEIGCGNSTKILQLALRRNSAETGQECEHICIEPYEMPWLEQLPLRSGALRRSRSSSTRSPSPSPSSAASGGSGCRPATDNRNPFDAGEHHHMKLAHCSASADRVGLQ